MKSLITRMVIVATVAVTSSAALHAQARTAVYGRTTIQISQAFSSLASSLGGSVQDLHLNPIANNILYLPVTTGVFNPTTGMGELDHSSGFALIGGGKTVRLQNFIIDSSNGAPVITADFVFNDTVLGRASLFDVTYPNGLSLPLPVNYGVLQVNGLQLTLSSTGAGMLNKIFGINVIPAGLSAGTASIYTVFEPLPNGTL